MHTHIPMHAKVRKETQIETHIAMEAALLISHKRKRTFIRNYRYNR